MEKDYLMREIMGLSCVWHRVIENKMSDIGLTSIQSRMLSYLYFQSLNGKKVFQRELEQEFQIRKSSITSVIQMMEKKELIRRISVPEDGRQKELVITEKGISVQETVIGRLNTLEELVNGVISQDERALLFSCIRKIETRLKEAEYD